MTNIEIKSLAAFQRRIFEWQRDVAGQPVCTNPASADNKFTEAQFSFIAEEWAGEFVSHFPDYMVLAATGDDREPDGLIAIADDIADTAFVALGYLNSRGLMIEDGHEPPMPYRTGIGALVLSINTHLVGLHSLTGQKCVDSCVAAMCQLDDLSSRLGISFFDALRAVCNSNDTKLWKDDEVKSGLPDGAVAVRIKSKTDRHWRVVSQKGKLLKSPSFTKPDLTAAVFGQYSLIEDKQVFNT